MNKLFLLAADATTTPTTPAGPIGRLNNAGSAGGYVVGQGADVGLINVISIVLKAALSLTGVIFLALLVFGGYVWMTAGGDESKVEKAKQTIGRATIGIVIVLASLAIAQFIIPWVLCATGVGAACPIDAPATEDQAG